MDWQSLLDRADPGSLSRGRDYARRRLVTIRRQTAGHVVAEAHGTTTYDVVLHARDWSCSCPMGVSDVFCKHLVATALLADAGTPDVAVADDVGPAHGAAGRARRTGGGRYDDDAVTGAVNSLRVGGHPDYRRANQHGEHAHVVVDDLESWLTASSAGPMLPHLERGIDHVVRAIRRSDDSSGIQSEALGRLLILHERCAGLARPDPKRLARWLVRTGTSDEGWPAVDVVPYATPLGEVGLAAYRSALGKTTGPRHSTSLVRYCHQRLAVLSGDVDQIVLAVGEGLVGWHRYPDVVEALLEAGHPEQALRYAVEAIDRTDVQAFRLVPVVDTAVRLLRERGGDAALDQALRLRLRQLSLLPDSRSYGSLRQAAEERSSWPIVRLGALDVLLERAPSVWLTVLVDEGEVELAWEASRTMTLGTALTHRLLRAWGMTHPHEVFSGYVALVDDTLVKAEARSYRQAVVYLGELRRLSAGSGQTDRYLELVHQLLETHRRRPTLVPMLQRMLP